MADIARLKGPYFLASSILVSGVTIWWVMWDNRSQQRKRTAGVRSILLSAQQKQNMEEYLEQRQKYEQYKSAMSGGGGAREEETGGRSEQQNALRQVRQKQL